MRELAEFMAVVDDAKRDLKEVYYTTRSERVKKGARELVALTVAVQRVAKGLLERASTSRLARGVLTDRHATARLETWRTGLPARVADYKRRARELRAGQLEPFQQALAKYIRTISEELTAWDEDIDTLEGLPRPPR